MLRNSQLPDSTTKLLSLLYFIDIFLRKQKKNVAMIILKTHIDEPTHFSKYLNRFSFKWYLNGKSAYLGSICFSREKMFAFDWYDLCIMHVWYTQYFVKNVFSQNVFTRHPLCPCTYINSRKTNWTTPK